MCVASPAGANSIVPSISRLSATPRNRAREGGTCSRVSVATWIRWERGPIFTLSVQVAWRSSATWMSSTPGTQEPTFFMSLRNAHARSTGTRTSKATVPSGMRSAPRRRRAAVAADLDAREGRVADAPLLVSAVLAMDVDADGQVVPVEGGLATLRAQLGVVGLHPPRWN